MARYHVDTWWDDKKQSPWEAVATDGHKSSDILWLERQRAKGATVTECTLERCWRCYTDGRYTPMPFIEPGEILAVMHYDYSQTGLCNVVRALQRFDPEIGDVNHWIDKQWCEAIPFREIGQ